MNIIIEDDDQLVLPKEKIERVRYYMSLSYLIIVAVASFFVMTKTNFKLEKSVKILILGFLVLFAALLVQSYTESIDEQANTLQDAIIVMIYEGCWALIYYFISQMQIVSILLLSFENIDDKSQSNILKSNQSKGERIRN
jgi:hypothetical protein